LAEIDSKELLKEFTNATWHSTPEMNEFVRRAIAQGEFPIKKAYEIMNENGHISNPAIFKKRIYCFELIANTVKKPSTAEFFLGVLISSPGPIQTALLRVLKEINDPEWHPHAVKLLNHKKNSAAIESWKRNRIKCRQIKRNHCNQLKNIDKPQLPQVTSDSQNANRTDDILWHAG
jgi:hypothetical protein